MKIPTYMKHLNIFHQYYFSWRYLSSWFKNIGLFFRTFKWAWQRATRGFADYDVWDLDHYLGTLTAATLIHLSNHHWGVPYEFQENPDEWTKWLQDTADLIKEAKHTEDDYSIQDWEIRHNKAKDLRHQVFERLEEHWEDLWD